MEYVLDDISSLRKLRREGTLKNSIRKIKLIMDNPLQAKTLEQRLNKYYFACGCHTGGAAVSIALFFTFLLWWYSGFIIFISWWKIVIIIAACAFAGKLTGLFISRYRLKKLFHVLEDYYTEKDYIHLM
ncbi:MAG: hypothetical protein ABI691_17890 [Ginsengibacter sp.]